jgi:hypothetical protein
MQTRIRLTSACALVLAASACQKTLPVVDDNTAGSGAQTNAATGSSPSKFARASADLQSVMGSSVTGDVSFMTSGDGYVTETAHVHNCKAGEHYYVDVLDATSCSAVSSAQTWSRGYPNITACDDLGVVVIDPTPQAKMWSIGGDKAADVVGRVAVIETQDQNAVILACGAIAKK